MAKSKKIKKHRKFWLVVKILILVILLTVLGGGLFLYLKYGDEVIGMQQEAKELVAQSTEDTFRSSETTIAYTKKGKQLAVLKGDKDAYYLTIDKIPKYVQDAFLVTEDKKFYQHDGIDMKGIFRAAVALIKNNGEKKQGASTITQQLARGVFLNTDKTYERKIKEIFIARELEKKYSKTKILEFYLNSVYFANGYYGIEAAAKGYFSKSCQDLSLAQICFLCSIPNNPNLYNPEKNMDNTLKRKNRILDQMLSDGVINQVEYDEAYNEEIKLNIQKVTKRNYIQTFITNSATKALMKYNGFDFQYSFSSDSKKKDYEEEYEDAYATAQQMLLNKGYRIYTSINLTKQKQLQKAVDDNLASFKEKTDDGVYKMQGSAVSIDNKTGRVVAIVGGRSQETEGYSLNRAYQSFRQPGSSIKPLVVYTPTLERGSTARTTVYDHKFNGGPSNSDGRYYGYVSLRFAVEHSLNTVAWQLFDKLTPEVGLGYLQEMHFTKLVKSDYHDSAALGGLTYGASSLEMASAYATLANDGKFREPTCIIKIQDADGNVIIDDSIKEKKIYDEDAAHAMVDILKGVFTSGSARGLALNNGTACAGKTGTTNDHKDGWFCGFTPYYTTAVWVGYDSPKEVSDLYGSSYPGRTWKQYMDAIHEKLPVKQFEFTLSSTYSGTGSSGSSSGSYSSSKDSSSSSSSDKDQSSVDTDPDDNNDVDTDPSDSQATKAPAAVTDAPTITDAPVTAEPEPAATEPPDQDNTGGDAGTDTTDPNTEQ